MYPGAQIGRFLADVPVDVIDIYPETGDLSGLRLLMF